MGVDKGKFVPLTHFGDVAIYLDALTNRAILGAGMDDKAQQLIQDAIYNLWSAQSVTVDTEKVLGSLKSILKEYQTADTMGQDQLWKLQETKIKAIFVHSFMDENDFDVSAIVNAVPIMLYPDGPFDARMRL